MGTCEILTSITPDHSGVRLEFNDLVDKFVFGKSYWKFNSSLCMDKDFVEEVNKEIQELKAEWSLQILNKLVFWDFLKMKMREFIITYSRKKAKARRVEIELLEKQIKDLEGELVVGPTKYIVDCIEGKRDKLNKL